MMVVAYLPMFLLLLLQALPFLHQENNIHTHMEFFEIAMQNPKSFVVSKSSSSTKKKTHTPSTMVK
jgi:hypothetical protein